MLQIYSQLVPLFFMFILGIILRRMNFAQAQHGEFLLKFMFFITLPVLVFLKLTQADLDFHKLSLPLANIGVDLGCMLVTLAIFRFTHIRRQTQGAMIISTMITNNAFMFPFMLAVFGGDGFAYAVLFDFGNAILVSTLTYALAFKYGPDRHTSRTLITKTLRSPLFWALLIAVTMNFMAMPVPHTLQLMLEPLGQMTNPLILVSLGILFTPRLKQLRLVSMTLAIRVGAGLILGMAIASLLGLQGLVFIVVTLCAAGPVGFNALTYASLAKLDTELASNAVSISILLGVIYIPLLMYLVPRFTG
jgi:predicted permease